MANVSERVDFAGSKFPLERVKEILHTVVNEVTARRATKHLAAYPDANEYSHERHAATVEGLTALRLQVTVGNVTRTYNSFADLDALAAPWDALDAYLYIGSNSTDTQPQSLYVRVYSHGLSNIDATIEAEVYDQISVIAEMAAQEGMLPRPSETPSIFLGHGGTSDSWRIVVTELERRYSVQTFESRPRSGLGIQNILKDLLDTSNFAVLVYTAEDEQADTTMRARQNVVHETGLFQGRHGFERVALLVEEGTVSFSNMDGLQYIPYTRGRILDVVPQIFEQIAREFPDRA
ncbi:TIR domain-containing protein [Rathayibacter sp. VKM Ac-2927]|uniref:TIR domain-containing protein n=1 Tax=Rathayibacter sp. VKM Ac-2927 TaxID=2929478 RepID=UPI001FB38F79|nr:TIR domain-containing protein [Rathayibacter sp. VKM Ac-2927]MCJ1687860.1 nucleotide-binding protein [Rathayibacter sp. VKM Ac-2927]